LDLGLDIINGMIKTLRVVEFVSFVLDLGLDIINGIKSLCVVAFRSIVLDLGFDLINGIKPYVCMHLRLYVAHGTFLRCATLGTSLIMYMYGDELNPFLVCNSRNIIIGLCLHDAYLSLYVAHSNSLGFVALITSTMATSVGACELVYSELNLVGVYMGLRTSLMAYVSKAYV